MCPKCPNWGRAKTQKIPQKLESSVFTLPAGFMSAALVTMNSSTGISQDCVYIVKKYIGNFKNMQDDLISKRLFLFMPSCNVQALF